MENIFYEAQSFRSFLLQSIAYHFIIGFVVYSWALSLYFNMCGLQDRRILIISIFVVFMTVYYFFKYQKSTRYIQNMFVCMNLNMLSYGYNFLHGKTIIEIPFEKIEKIKFCRRGFFYIKFCKRPLYVSKTGYLVEIDWDKNKKHGFSITDHESFFHAVRSKIDNNLIDYDPEKLR